MINIGAFKCRVNIDTLMITLLLHCKYFHVVTNSDVFLQGSNESLFNSFFRS